MTSLLVTEMMSMGSRTQLECEYENMRADHAHRRGMGHVEGYSSVARI